MNICTVCFWIMESHSQLGPPFLKNLPPCWPIPVPSRLLCRRDLASGRHLSSFRLQNWRESSGLISMSLILLQYTTRSAWSSLYAITTISSPTVVRGEHPSKERSFRRLHDNSKKCQSQESNQKAENIYFQMNSNWKTCFQKN